MSDAADADHAALLAAEDAALAAVILAATGIPATPADMGMWRSALRRLLHRRRREREGEAPPHGSPPPVRSEARELVGDFLMSVEGQTLIAALRMAAWTMLSLPGATIAAARSRWAILSAARGLAPTPLDCAHAYAIANSAPGGVSAADYWLASRVPAPARAALHAATPERLAFWSDRLALARASARPSDGVLRGLAAEGAAAQAAHPDLDLGAVSPGPALGIWPPAAGDGDGASGLAGPAL